MNLPAVITAGSDHLIKSWDTAGSLKKVVGTHEEGVTTLLLNDSSLISASRDGALKVWNLTTGDVNRNQFGKLFSYPVDGYVFAQPLYVQGVSILNQGTHNVVYVATESDTVFAFDADNNGSGGGQLWQTSFVNPANGVTTVPRADTSPRGRGAARPPGRGQPQP